jgi:hypothetical protein
MDKLMQIIRTEKDVTARILSLRIAAGDNLSLSKVVHVYINGLQKLMLRDYARKQESTQFAAWLRQAYSN